MEGFAYRSSAGATPSSPAYRRYSDGVGAPPNLRADGPSLAATSQGVGANDGDLRRGSLPQLSGAAAVPRPWGAASGSTESVTARDAASGPQRPLPPGLRGGSGTFFSTHRYESLASSASPYAPHAYGSSGVESAAAAATRERPASAFAYRYTAAEGRLPSPSSGAGPAALGASPIRAWRQSGLPSSTSGAATTSADRDLVTTPKPLDTGRRAPTPLTAQLPNQVPQAPTSLPTSDSGAAASLAVPSASAGEQESDVLERVAAQQAELVESIRERLRTVQAKKQFMQEQLVRVRQQEQAEVRAAAAARGRLEEERAQVEAQVEQLQAQLESVREQRESLAREYAARDAERRHAAEKALQEREEVARIRRRLEELQRDMQERLAAEESRYQARLESARAASAQAERSAQWLTEVEGRLAAATSPSASAPRS